MSVIVYTTIFGESDSLKPAPVGADQCVCFVDRPWADHDSLGWEMVQIAMVSTPRRDAWHLRCVPHTLFADYSRVVWVDASFEITDLGRLLADAGAAPIAALRHHERFSCYHEGARLVRIGQSERSDVNRQLEAYRRAGFTSPHLSVSCLIVRDRSEAVRRFNQTWDDEISRHPGDNTQVSLDYSAWLHAITIRALVGNRHDNPYATHDHLDHRTRRRPYAS